MEQKYYYGNAISEHGMQNGRVDYRTLAKCFDAVLNNNIMQLTYDIGYLDQVSGTVDNFLIYCKKGLALLQEHYLNPWQSDYYVMFARYDDKDGTNIIWDIFEKRIDYDDE